ncbi:MAG: tetratricopeptide repeat protein [Myxococcota bacterium]
MNAALQKSPLRMFHALLFALALAGCPKPPEDAASTGDEDIMFPDERAALEAERHPATSVVARGERAMAAGNLEEALEAFDAAIAENDADPRAHLDRGLALELQNQYIAAEQSYRRAVELDGDFPEALNNLGLLLRDQSRSEEALPLLVRAVELRGTYGEAWFNLGLAHEDLGSLAEARDAYRTAARHLPDEPSVRVSHGMVLLRMADDAPDEGNAESLRTQGAIELRRALSLARGNAPLLLAVGNGLRRAGQPDGAVTAMEMALEATDPTPALLSELALAKRASGDAAGAIETLRHALRLDGGFGTAHYLLGSLLASAQNYAEAITHFERYLALEPNGPHAERCRAHLAAAQRLSR